MEYIMDQLYPNINEITHHVRKSNMKGITALVILLILIPMYYYMYNEYGDSFNPNSDIIVVENPSNSYSEYWYVENKNPYILYFDFNEFNVDEGSTLIFNWTMARGRFTIKQNGINILMTETNGTFAYQPLLHSRLMLDFMMFDWYVGITIIN